MKIRYLGHSCFEITGNNHTTIITDPYTKVGYELPKGLTANYITVSHGHFDHAYVSAISGNAKIIQDEQTFLENGIEFKGVKTFHDAQNGQLRGENIVHIFTVDGITCCHLGDIGEPYFDEIAQKIGKIDVLFIPIGGTYTIDAIQAQKYAQKLAPKMVIPMHYKPKDGCLDIQDEKAFLDLFDEKSIVRVDGLYDLERSDFSQEQKIIFMERVK